MVINHIEVEALTIADFRSPVATDHRLNKGPIGNHTPINSLDIGPYPVGSWDGPIYASAAGTVEFVGWSSNDYGNQIVINHGDGWKTRYAHLSGFSVQHLSGNHVYQQQYDATFVVSKNQYVQKGQLIGFMGNTGNSTNVHLHFEIIKTGEDSWVTADQMKTLSWINLANSGQYKVGVYGQPVSDPACNNRTYSGVDFLYSPYCQDGSARYLNNPGQYTVNLNDVDSIYVGSGWSVFVTGNDGSGQCVNRSMWDLRKDFYPSGASLHNNIKTAHIHNNSTCSGMVSPYNPGSPGSQIPGTGGGGSGHSNGYLEIFNTVNYSGKIYNLAVGTHYFSVNTLMFSFRLQGAGSFIVHAPDGRNQCFNQNVPNMQDHSEYWRETIRIVVYPGNVCSSTTGGGSSGYVEIFKAVNYSGNKLGNYNIGTHTFPINTLMFSFRMRDGAKSFVVHAPDGRWECFNENVPNMESYSEYWRETVRLDVHANDVCTTAPPKPQYGEVKLWSQLNFQGNMLWHGNLGFSNNPSANSHSLEFPSGWSATTYAGDNRTGQKRCWQNSVSNLAAYGWQEKIQSIDVHNFNSCPIVAAPTSLDIVKFSDDTVELIWQDNSDNETHFQVVMLYANTGEELSVRYNVAANSNSLRIDNYLECEVEYLFYVIAKNTTDFNNQISSDHSNWVRLKMANCPVIAAPGNVQVVNSNSTSLVLSWQDNSNNEDYFKVWYFKEGDNQWHHKIVNANVTGYTLMGLTCESRYSIAVWAMDENNIGASETLSVQTNSCIALAPSNLHSTQISHNAITIAWQDNSDNEDAFEVYRVNNNGNSILIASVNPNTTSYNIVGLSCNTEYKFYVSATNAYSQAQSGTLVITTSVCPPHPQTPVAPTINYGVATQNFITLHWQDNSSNEEFFDVIMIAPDHRVLSVPANFNSAIVTELSCGTTYQWRIRSRNQYGHSDSALYVFGTEACEATGMETPVFSVVKIINGYSLGNEVQLHLENYNANYEYGVRLRSFPAGQLQPQQPNNSWTDFQNGVDRHVIWLEPCTQYAFYVLARYNSSIAQSETIVLQTSCDYVSEFSPDLWYISEDYEHQVILYWNDLSSNEESFEVYMDNEIVGIAGENSTSFIIIDMECGVDHTFKVVAVTEDGPLSSYERRAHPRECDENVVMTPVITNITIYENMIDVNWIGDPGISNYFYHIFGYPDDIEDDYHGSFNGGTIVTGLNSCKTYVLAVSIPDPGPVWNWNNESDSYPVIFKTGGCPIQYTNSIYLPIILR